mgnify:CR=1 FL=1
MTKRQGDVDTPATKVELTHGISSSMWLSKLNAGLVPIYEEHRVRADRGIDIETWSRMNVDEKAIIIAISRVSNAIQNLQTEAEIDAMKK